MPKPTNPNPRTYYPGNHQEAAMLAKLLPALSAHLNMSESAVIRYALVDLARCEADLPGGGAISAILAAYDASKESE